MSENMNTYANNVERKVVLGPLSEAFGSARKLCGVCCLSVVYITMKNKLSHLLCSSRFLCWGSGLGELRCTVYRCSTRWHYGTPLSLPGSNSTSTVYVSFPNLQLVVLSYIISFSEAFERLTFPTSTYPYPIFPPIRCWAEEVECIRVHKCEING